MRKERKIINTNIRLNLCDEQDRQAWEYLQTMDREKYKSYTRAVVVALNDYFSSGLCNGGIKGTGKLYQQRKVYRKNETVWMERKLDRETEAHHFSEPGWKESA